MEFKLNSFLSKSAAARSDSSIFPSRPEAAVDTVYPLQAATFSGSLASWVGRYQKPQENVSFTVHGVRDGARRSNDGQDRACRGNRSIIRNCRGSGLGPASTPCSKKSNATAKIKPRSTKSFASPVNTNLSRPTLHFWQCLAPCCGRA
jgi:hypothetical protein